MIWTFDAGHGGWDNGATNLKAKEKDINLIVAKEVQRLMILNGEAANMTRETDVYMSLTSRCDFANKKGSTYFLSIHHNAGGGNGAEAIYSIYHGEGETLANVLVKNFRDIGQNTRRTFCRVGDNGRDYYAVIRQTKMIAVISEFGFMDTSDYEAFDTYTELMLEAQAITKSCLEMVGKTFKSVEFKSGYEKRRFMNTDVHIYTSKSVPEVVLGRRNVRELLPDIAKQYTGVKCAVNGQMFAYDGSENDGYGLLITDNGQRKAVKDFYQPSHPTFLDLIAWNNGNVSVEVGVPGIQRLAFIQGHAHFGIGSSYALKIDGQDSQLNWDKFAHSKQYAQRTMIGMDAMYNWYMIVSDGRTWWDKGFSAIEQTKLANDLGLIYCVNFDGGNSSDMVIPNGPNMKVVSGNYRCERAIGSAFIMR